MYENDERRREKRMKEYNININNLVLIHFRKNFIYKEQNILLFTYNTIILFY